MSEIGGIGSNVAVERARAQLNADTKTYDTSSEAVVDFGKQKSSGADEVKFSTTDLKSISDAAEKATSNVQTLTKSVGDLTSQLEGLTAEYNVANTNGDKDASKIKASLDQLRTEVENKKLELEQAKNDEATSKADKQTAEMTLQKLECKLQDIDKQLGETQKTNATDKTTMDASQVNLTEVEKKAVEEAKAAEEVKKAEEAKKAYEASKKEAESMGFKSGGEKADAILAEHGCDPKLMAQSANAARQSAEALDSRSAEEKKNDPFLCQQGVRTASEKTLGLEEGSLAVGDAIDASYVYANRGNSEARDPFSQHFEFLGSNGDLDSETCKQLENTSGVIVGYIPKEVAEKGGKLSESEINKLVQDGKLSSAGAAYLRHGHMEEALGDGEFASDRIQSSNGKSKHDGDLKFYMTLRDVNAAGKKEDVPAGTGVPTDDKGVPDASYRDGSVQKGTGVPMTEEPFVNRASYRDGTGNVGSTTGGDGKVGSGKPEDDRLAGGDAVVGASVDGTLPVIGGDVEGVALDHAEPTVSSGTFKIGAFNTYEQARADEAANQNNTSIRNSGQKAMAILHGTGKIATDVPVGNFHADVENMPESLLSVMKDSNGDFTASGLYDMDMKSGTYTEKKSVFVPTTGSSGYTSTQNVYHTKIDNVITMDELTTEISQLKGKTKITSQEQARLNACEDLVQIMRDNNKTSFDNNLFRELIIDASKTGKNVNFLDALK